LATQNDRRNNFYKVEFFFRGMHLTQPHTISCGRRNCGSLVVFDVPLLAQFLSPAQRPETGNWQKGKSASTYAMLRDDRSADKKTRMATAGQTGIEGRLARRKTLLKLHDCSGILCHAHILHVVGG
jgi:hypothetical protein